ncbi:hypothetical protein [Herbaspirillum sp. NPDC087042]|uniref:hypothetical protein n=1 Tax=Herbaspirillum sp. NPDC087042 TaxID=3364004 RepID=UPI0038155FC6
MNNIDSLDNRTFYPGATSTQGGGNAAASSFESQLQLAKAGGSLSSSVKSDPVRELQEWAAMTPDQRLFYMVLNSMGVSKEQYDQMSAEDKQKLVEKVREQIKEMALNPAAMG